MTSTQTILLAMSGSLVISVLLLGAFAWLVRSRLARAVRDAEHRIYQQLNGREAGLRPRLDRVELESGAQKPAVKDLRRRLRELETELQRQRHATEALTLIAKGLTQAAIQAEERTAERESAVGSARK